MSSIRIGDTFTIVGVHKLLPNPARQWWQLWKPRTVAGPPLNYQVLSEWTQ